MKLKPQLIFLGAPGSGKGTQAAHLVKEYGYRHISTGALLRTEIDKKSDLGLKVKNILDQGNLVNDDMILELLRSHCDLSSEVHIFDGIPRTLEQAKQLDEKFIKDSYSGAIYFEIGFDDLMHRLVNRYICADCGAIYNLTSRMPKKEGQCDVCGSSRLEQRKDDKVDIVNRRFKVFEKTMGEILDYYKSKERLKKVDATADEDSVHQSIRDMVEVMNK